MLVDFLVAGCMHVADDTLHFVVFTFTRFYLVHRRLSLYADTSLTNFFAFMLGSATSLPAVEYFCIYAGVAILFNFFLQAR